MSRITQLSQQTGKAFGTLRAKGASIKAAVVGAPVMLMTSMQSHALALSESELQAEIDAAKASADTAISMGQLALLGIVALLVGFGFLIAILKKG